MTPAPPTTEPSPAALAASLGQRLFGQAPLASRFQAVNSDVFRLDFGRQDTPHVLKLAKANPAAVLREQQVLRSLQARGFEVPAVEFTQLDCPDVTRPFTVLPLVRGTSAAAIYSQDARRGTVVFERLGRFIARLGTLQAAEVPGALPVPEAQALEQAACAQVTALYEERSWRSKTFDAWLQAIQQHLTTPPTVFGYRDGGHLITDGADTFSVIDWGEAGAVWPYSDLARCIHGVRATNDVRGGQWLAALLRGFGEVRPLESGWIETVETWLCYLCMREATQLKARGQEYSISRVLTLARQTPNRQWMEGT